jgi:hypothetical protein
MKSKKNIYILLPVVLCIWGLLIYRFFSFTNTEVAFEAAPDYSVKPVVMKPRDTIRIDVNYRDPFLGKMYNPVTAVARPATQRRTAAAPAPEIPWPLIAYKGIVSDIKDREKVFMIVINGRSSLMHEKETEQDVTLVKGNNSQITVKHKGRQNIIMLQQ